MLSNLDYTQKGLINTPTNSFMLCVIFKLRTFQHQDLYIHPKNRMAPPNQRVTELKQQNEWAATAHKSKFTHRKEQKQSVSRVAQHVQTKSRHIYMTFAHSEISLLIRDGDVMSWND